MSRSYHRLFGLTLASELPLESHLAPGRPPADVAVRLVSEPPAHVDLGELRPVYESPFRDADGESLAHLYRPDPGGLELLSFPAGAEFWLSGGRIDVRLLDPAYRPSLELRLLGPVIAYWLERAGIPVLHAAAVELGGRAVGFLAGNQGGKSSLAATLVEVGHLLVTDDLLPVEEQPRGMIARPGAPQMRLWPEAARWFAGAGADELPRVHPHLDKRRLPVARFAAEPLPLGRLYLPERRPGAEIAIVPVSPREALIELLARSFIPQLAASGGREGKRFERLARVAERVPVFQLVYPEGLDRLTDVARAVAAHDI